MTETTFTSPLGPIVLRASGGALTDLRFGGGDDGGGVTEPPSDPVLAETCVQLEAYFAGERSGFDLPLEPAGTPFDRRVWAAVAAIPHGQTATYGELAAQLGAPGAARAVGAANGRNPIAIVIPCHRVIGARGALTGYAYGVERKAALLALEGGALPLAV